MATKEIILLFLLFFFTKESQSQCLPFGTISNIAYPICGNTTHSLSDAESMLLDFCETSEVYVRICRRNGLYLDKSPFWYKFTCYQGGTLGFMLTPNILSDDYNWHLYDITGVSPFEVYKVNPYIGVAGNWSGTPGITGASALGSPATFQCFTDPAANISAVSRMPTLITGHNYLLLISHQAGSGGYSIQFDGGTADLADPIVPKMAAVTTTCPGGPLSLKFNKKMNCSTIYPFGSDFSISPPLANISVVNLLGCNTNFGTDSIILQLNNFLPAGNYSLNIVSNTVSDFCGRFIAAGESIPFVVGNVPPTLMDSITQPACGTSELQLVFKKPIRCMSVELDGSEFIITGTTPVNVIKAVGYKCTGALETASSIKLTLAAPLLDRGNYQIKLVKGTDNNTILDECGREIPAGSTLDFLTFEAVHAAFTYNVRYGCAADTIDYFHDGQNDVNSWKWNFGEGLTRSVQNPRVIYRPFGTKLTKLKVSNGACSDSSEVAIFLGTELKAAFEATNTVCPDKPAFFENKSFGDIISWSWDFGNGNTSGLQFPPTQYYPTPNRTTTVVAKLTTTNNKGCVSTALQNIVLANSCYVLVPNAFTPNHDGLNDYLSPVNVYNRDNFSFKIYNRYGSTVFESNDPSKKWDGRFKGQNADPGTYLWILRFTDSDGKLVQQKGTSILLH